MIFFVFIIFSVQVLAQTDMQLVDEATKRNEKALIEKYNIMYSPWFETSCMLLAKKMEFNEITQCKLFKSKNINAYILSNGHVYFSLAMMQQIKNKPQWASILAHENAHLELNHYIKTLQKIKNPGLFFPKSKLKKMLVKHEKQADKWAKNALLKYGLDPQQIYFFLQRVIKLTGNLKSNNHLQLYKRINNNNGVEVQDNKLMVEVAKLLETNLFKED